GPERMPQPTLADIDALLGRDRDLPVDLVVDEAIGELPHSVMLTGYRVVQEALTNVRRHAGPVERVEVRVRRDDDRLAIAITDDGRGAAADDVGPGYGIVGMRERIAAMGGDINVGPRIGGGWQVQFSIPVEQHVATRPRETTA
ncbi:MAG: sensor histidine kinase, partial [Ilumatobacteraceae bacterium]